MPLPHGDRVPDMSEEQGNVDCRDEASQRHTPSFCVFAHAINKWHARNRNLLQPAPPSHSEVWLTDVEFQLVSGPILSPQGGTPWQPRDRSLDCQAGAFS